MSGNRSPYSSGKRSPGRSPISIFTNATGLQMAQPMSVRSRSKSSEEKENIEHSVKQAALPLIKKSESDTTDNRFGQSPQSSDDLTTYQLINYSSTDSESDSSFSAQTPLSSRSNQSPSPQILPISSGNSPVFTSALTNAPIESLKPLLPRIISDEEHSASLIKVDSVISHLVSAITPTQEFSVDKKKAEDELRRVSLHIVEEEIEIASLAEGKKGDPHVGIYYPHFQKATTEMGKHIVNMPGYYPGKLAFINKINSPNEPVPFYKDLSLTSKHKKPFIYNNAFIFMPICYTTDHALGGEALSKALRYFYNQNVATVFVYLGRDEGNPVNIKMREKWLADNKEILDTFSSESENSDVKTKIEIGTRAKFENTQRYRRAQALFIEVFTEEEDVQEGFKHDILERLRQKNFLKIPTPANSAQQSKTNSPPRKPKAPAPLPSSLSPSSLFNSKKLNGNRLIFEEKAAQRDLFEAAIHVVGTSDLTEVGQMRVAGFLRLFASPIPTQIYSQITEEAANQKGEESKNSLTNT